MSLFKNLSTSLFFSLFLFTAANAASSINIENAWSPEAPPVAKVMAGYMKMNNLSQKDIKLTSAKSSLFKRVEIHLTEMDKGMMRMIKQDNLNIKAQSFIELTPGGLHMMLIGKLKAVKAGSTIPVTLQFDNGEQLEIKLYVKVNEEPQQMNHHHHH